MRTLEGTYPLVVTERVAECRDFYVRRLGFEVGFEASWIVYLAAPAPNGHGIGFMAPEHPSRPPGSESFGGRGLLLTLQVSDAEAEFQRISAAGVEVAHPLTDEPWGQRRFALLDPAGIWVDVVEQIEPEPGWWDAYTPDSG